MMAYVGWTLGSIAILGGVLYLGDHVQNLMTPTPSPLKGASRRG